MSDEQQTRTEPPKRISLILDSSRPLCREDIIWVLHYVQKKSGLERPGAAGSLKATIIANLRQVQ
ncbi:hypothetical protein [Paenibacillus sp. DMB20]|uniref:hypothetical protein n=1 Tax=Paenibacillus sp. DMB20 TaxID=1642570 RepID=UPI000699DA75|nr:hypothetical protein [Paenibacillus sp. DMB20]